MLITLGPAQGFDIWEKVARIRDELPDLKAILVVGARRARCPRATLDFDALVEAQPADRLASGRQIAPNDVAAYFHTGGTTGLPQLVPLTHGNQVYQAWGMALMFRTRPGSTLLMGLPLFHVGGALTQGLQHLRAGGTLVVLSAQGWRNKSAMPNIWRLVERYRPELLGGVPTVLGAVLNVPIEGHDVSSIRKVHRRRLRDPRAGRRRLQAPLRPPDARDLRHDRSVELPHDLVPGAAGVPGLGRASAAVQPRARRRGRRHGKFVRDCPPDKIGVVTMHGPGVFSGYVTGAPDAPFVEPGWVNSGDLGRVDANGYLWITGRAKDLIIRGGHNIDPTRHRGGAVRAPGGRGRRRRRRARRLRRRTAGRLRAAEAGRQRRPAPSCSSTPRPARPSAPPCRCSCTSSTRSR